MLIVVEGPDETGKTTLARELAESYDLKYVHRGPPKLPPLKEYSDLAVDCARDVWGLETGVIDRWHLGQAVYPFLPVGLAEERVALTLAEELWLNWVLQARGALLVAATGIDHRIKARIKASKKDSYLEVDDVTQCVQLFENAYRRCTLPRLDHNIDVGPIQTTLHVGAAAEAAHKRARYLGDLSVVGEPYNPQVLLVGDTVNTPWTSLPFAPESTGSGRFLLEALLEVWNMTDLGRVLVINSFQEGSSVDLKQVWRITGQPRVVALGARADEALLLHEVPHGAVPHPQYMRRFKHGLKRDYGWGLVAAAGGANLMSFWKDKI